MPPVDVVEFVVLAVCVFVVDVFVVDPVGILLDDGAVVDPLGLAVGAGASGVDVGAGRGDVDVDGAGGGDGTGDVLASAGPAASPKTPNIPAPAIASLRLPLVDSRNCSLTFICILPGCGRCRIEPANSRRAVLPAFLLLSLYSSRFVTNSRKSSSWEISTSNG